MSNFNLNKARKYKNNEFYTSWDCIEKGLVHYKHHFKGMNVLCNCNDALRGDFFNYFSESRNFERLGLKKVVATSYSPNHNAIFGRCDPAFMISYDGNSLESEKFADTGGFGTIECLDLLEEADIVCTNPPFSLFSEFINLLNDHEKKFLVIGNLNAICESDVFPLIQKNRVWLGYDGYGMKFRDQFGDMNLMGFACWFTNMDADKSKPFIPLVKKYNPDKYPKYDNYDAIEVSKVDNIPYDYDDVMGVPVSFFSKYNPDQFEIIGQAKKDCNKNIPETMKYTNYREMRQDGIATGAFGSKIRGNAMIVRNDGKKNYYSDGKRILQSVYQRIFIRKKQD